MYIGQDGHEHGMGMAWVCPLEHRSVVFYPLPILSFLFLSLDFFLCTCVCVCLLKKSSCLPSPSLFFHFGAPYSCHPIRLSPSTPPFFSSLPFHISMSLVRSFFVVGWLTLLRFLSPSYALAPSYDWIPLFLLTSPLEVHSSLLPFPFSWLS